MLNLEIIQCEFDAKKKPSKKDWNNNNRRESMVEVKEACVETRQDNKLRLLFVFVDRTMHWEKVWVVKNSSASVSKEFAKIKAKNLELHSEFRDRRRNRDLEIPLLYDFYCLILNQSGAQAMYKMLFQSKIFNVELI